MQIASLKPFILSLPLIMGGCATAPTTSFAMNTSSCDDICLNQLAGIFMDNMVDQYPAGVPFAANIRMTENGEGIEPGAGIWETSLGWSYRHTFVDAQQGGIGIFGVIHEKSGKKAIVALRLKVENMRFTESEALVVHEGEFPLFATDMTRARPLYYSIVPEEKRSTREELEAIAEAYFHGLANGDPTGLKFHPDCNRRENGVQTTNSPPRFNRSCADLYPFVYMHSYRKPAYPVINTEYGLVLGVTAFDMPDLETEIMIRGKPIKIDPSSRRLPRTLFLYELFKVEDGQIMIIDAFLANYEYGKKMGWDER